MNFVHTPSNVSACPARLSRAQRRNPDHQCLYRGRSTALCEYRSRRARADSRNWDVDEECGTITHEVMHLLGLCDEYREQVRGYVTDTETGQVRQVEDIREEALDKDDTFQAEYQCRATAPLVGLDVQSPPARFERAHRPHDAGSSERADFDTLLWPGHWNVLIYPNCEAFNQDYFTCAELAYWRTPGGREEHCPERPPECTSLDWIATDHVETQIQWRS